MQTGRDYCVDSRHRSSTKYTKEAYGPLHGHKSSQDRRPLTMPKTAELSASSVTPVKSYWKSSWIDWNYCWGIAWFKAGSSTLEHVVDPRIISEMHLQHKQDLNHVFIDCKKAFDGLWQTTLWINTMRRYKINENLIQTIQQMFDKASIAVCIKENIADCFKTTVSVKTRLPTVTYCQCLLDTNNVWGTGGPLR